MLSRVLNLIKGLFSSPSQTISQEKISLPEIDVKKTESLPEIDFKAQIDRNWAAVQDALPSRTVILNGPITTETANDLMGHLLLLERLSRDPILLVISSEGGQAYAGLAIYDMLRHLTVPLITVADTTCAGNSLLLLMAGQKRYALADSFIGYTMLRSDAPKTKYESDHVIQSREIQRLQAIHDAIFQQYKQSDWDLTTEHHLSPEEAVQYKWIDAVVNKIEDIDRN